MPLTYLLLMGKTVCKLYITLSSKAPLDLPVAKVVVAAVGVLSQLKALRSSSKWVDGRQKSEPLLSHRPLLMNTNFCGKPNICAEGNLRDGM